jgi:diaminopimelate decarboxylase
MSIMNMYREKFTFFKQELQQIIEKYPTPFHIYDEKAIRENARRFKKAFEWNDGFKEYYAIKPPPILT